MKNKRTSRNDLYGDLILGALLVGLAVVSRFAFESVPNFSAVGAVALFGGFCFTRVWRAVIAIGLAMIVSDFFFGFYEWPVMASVYGSMAIAVLAGRALRRRDADRGLGWGRPLAVAGASLLVSIQFFLLTNAGVVLAGWYPMGVDGLLASYTAGLPFFRYTVVGDLLFAQSLFGMLALAQAIAARMRSHGLAPAVTR